MHQHPKSLLFVITDQQRFDAVGANGNPIIQTPAMDAIARSGANIQGFFTNAPVCVPSRTAMFTGRYPHSTKVRENYCFFEPGREMHLFRVLKQAGYKLGYTGKNHCFDHAERVNFGMFVEAGDNHPEQYMLSEAEQALMTDYWKYREATGIGPGQANACYKGGWLHDHPVEATRCWNTVEHANRFLNQQTSRKPFALAVSFVEPHVPHIVARELFEKYPIEDIPLPPAGGVESLAAKARRWLIKYGAQMADEASDEDKRRYIAIYYALISAVDAQIARLMAKLDSMGLREDTLIVFTSDHGDFAFQHGLAKKDLVHADCLEHVPLFISGPGISPQIVAENVLCEGVDLMPTILDFLGIEPPDGHQGRSFAPVLRGERNHHKDAVFAEVCAPYLYNKYPNYEAFAADNGGRGKHSFNIPGDFTKSIREQDWRYVWYGNGDEELYDHRAEGGDPHELRNLAASPAYSDVKNRLKLRLLEWHALTEDRIDNNILQDLQRQYHNWSPISFPTGCRHENPGWKETLKMPLAKPV